MSPSVKEAVQKECKSRVDVVQMLKSNDGKDAFKVEPTCALDDAQTTVHCTVDISPASDTMKSKLEAFPTTDLTLQIWFDDSQFVLGTPDHVVDDVATATMTKGEKVTVEFTTPFDRAGAPTTRSRSRSTSRTCEPGTLISRTGPVAPFRAAGPRVFASSGRRGYIPADARHGLAQALSSARVSRIRAADPALAAPSSWGARSPSHAWRRECARAGAQACDRRRPCAPAGRTRACSAAG